MSKTHHRRRHRRANRTRRGGVKHSLGASAAPAQPASAAPAQPASAAAAAAAAIDMAAIKQRVRELAAMGQGSQSHSKGITKKKAAEKHFSAILAGKAKHHGNSAFKPGSGVSDPAAARERGF